MNLGFQERSSCWKLTWCFFQETCLWTSGSRPKMLGGLPQDVETPQCGRCLGRYQGLETWVPFAWRALPVSNRVLQHSSHDNHYDIGLQGFVSATICSTWSNQEFPQLMCFYTHLQVFSRELQLPFWFHVGFSWLLRILKFDRLLGVSVPELLAKFRPLRVWSQFCSQNYVILVNLWLMLFNLIFDRIDMAM